MASNNKQTISDEQAAQSLVALVEYVFELSDGPLVGITYQALAERIGRLNKHDEPAARGMGAVLGRMGHLLQGIQDAWGKSVPHLQCLVVLKSGPDSGLPDVGLKEFWPGYERLSRAEKESKLAAEYERIRQFGSGWSDVLARLGLPQVFAASTEASKARRGAGGESPQHLALKRYLQEHPELVGAEPKWPCFLEYALPSLDEIDVVFKSKTVCIAVEVKSSVSDRMQGDYERGIYQVIKYRALLKAMALAGRDEMPGTIRVVLALQSGLPSQYRQLADDLKVDVIENINPET